LTDTGYSHELTVAARNQQGDKREAQGWRKEQRRQKVTFEMVYPDCRDSQRIPQAVGDARTHQQRTRETRPLRVCNRSKFLDRVTGSSQNLAGERQNPPHVVARGEFRNNAPIGGVERDLGVQHIAEQAPFRIVECNAGLVARGFYSQDQHTPVIDPRSSKNSRSLI
jgi:hypothetical protein